MAVPIPMEFPTAMHTSSLGLRLVSLVSFPSLLAADTHLSTLRGTFHDDVNGAAGVHRGNKSTT